MDAIRDADIDPAPLAGKRVAIIGYGNQGRAQALNLQRQRRRCGGRPARRLAEPGRGRGRRHRHGLADRRRRRRPTSSCCWRPTRSWRPSIARSSRASARARRWASATASPIRFGFIVAARRPRRVHGRAQGPRHRAALALSGGQGHGRAVGGRAGRERPGRGDRPRLRPGDRLRARRADLARASPRNARPTCSTSRRWCGARCRKS